MLLSGMLEAAVSPTTEKATSPASSCSRSRCFFSLAPGDLSLSRHLIRWLTRTPCVASWIMRFLSLGLVLDNNGQGGDSGVDAVVVEKAP